MAWSLVNTFTNDTGYTGTGVFTDYQVTVSGVSVGDLLIVQFQFGNNDVSATATCSDNAGVANTYTAEKAVYDTTNAQGTMRFSAPVGNVTGLTRVIVSWPTVAIKFVSCAVEQWHNSSGSFSGTVISGTPAGQDQASAGTGTDAVTSTNTTPGVNGCLIHSTLVYPGSAPATITHGTGFTAQLNDFVTVQMGSEYLVQTTAAGISGTWTQGTSLASIALVTAYAPPGGGGPTSKTDTDTGSLSEASTSLTNKSVGITDAATLAEQVPQIAPTAQTDSATLSETQTVTPSSATSKTDTDTATVTETTNPPTIGVTDSAILNDTAITLVVTDVQQIPDFTVTEQTPRIGLAPTDSLTFSETQTLTASFIRFVDSDAFGLAEATAPMASIAQRDTASLSETQAGTTYILDADALSQSDAAAITALLASLDTVGLADAQTLTIVGGFTGYAKGLLAVADRLDGALASTARLSGTLAGQDRLRGITTVAPVGQP